MARIVTVYRSIRAPFLPIDMSLGRWWKMSEALAARGHEVDMATHERRPWLQRPVAMGPRLRRVPLARVRWERYDVVKTEFHMGFETLEEHGGAGHPFVVSMLGSPVDRRDRPGVYFYGAEREELFRIQERIAATSRYVALLTRESRALWHECFGDQRPTLLVPGAAEAEIPGPGEDPYGGAPRPRCLFLGNLYGPDYQPEAHRRLAGALDGLGSELRRRGIDLYFVGPGDTSRIDPGNVRCLGPVAYERSWDYIHHADVGVVLALGPEPNHNESTKIYHYLRAGLPTVCEAGFPNQGLVEEARLGKVTPNGSPGAMAEAVEEAARSDWDREHATRLVIERHSWAGRAKTYGEILREHGLEPASASE